MHSNHAGIDVMLIYTHMHAHVLEQIHMVKISKITKNGKREITLIDKNTPAPPTPKQQRKK